MFEGDIAPFEQYFGETRSYGTGFGRGSGRGMISRFHPTLIKNNIVLTDQDRQILDDLSNKTRYYYYDYQSLMGLVEQQIMHNHRRLIDPFYHYIHYDRTSVLNRHLGNDQFWKILDTRFPDFPDKQVIWVEKINSNHRSRFSDMLLLIDDTQPIEPVNLVNRLLSPGGLEDFYHNCRDVPLPELGLLDQPQLSKQKFQALYRRLTKAANEISDFYDYQIKRGSSLSDQQLLIRLVQSLGASIIRQWIEQEKVICFYRCWDRFCYCEKKYYYCSPQRAKHFLTNRCSRCHKGQCEPSLLAAPVSACVWRYPHYRYSFNVLPGEEMFDLCRSCQTYNTFYLDLKREIDLSDYCRSLMPDGLINDVLDIMSQHAQILLKSRISLLKNFEDWDIQIAPWIVLDVDDDDY